MSENTIHPYRAQTRRDERDLWTASVSAVDPTSRPARDRPHDISISGAETEAGALQDLRAMVARQAEGGAKPGMLDAINRLIPPMAEPLPGCGYRARLSRQHGEVQAHVEADRTGFPSITGPTAPGDAEAIAKVHEMIDELEGAGDYFGGDVNLAHRVREAMHGAVTALRPGGGHRHIRTGANARDEAAQRSNPFTARVCKLDGTDDWRACVQAEGQFQRRGGISGEVSVNRAQALRSLHAAINIQANPSERHLMHEAVDAIATEPERVEHRCTVCDRPTSTLPCPHCAEAEDAEDVRAPGIAEVARYCKERYGIDITEHDGPRPHGGPYAMGGRIGPITPPGQEILVNLLRTIFGEIRVIRSTLTSDSVKAVERRAMIMREVAAAIAREQNGVDASEARIVAGALSEDARSIKPEPDVGPGMRKLREASERISAEARKRNDEELTAKLQNCTDGVEWADRFLGTADMEGWDVGELQQASGREILVAWFANAIEVGRTAGMREVTKAVDEDEDDCRCEELGWQDPNDHSKECPEWGRGDPLSPGDLIMGETDPREWALVNLVRAWVVASGSEEIGAEAGEIAARMAKLADDLHAGLPQASLSPRMELMSEAIDKAQAFLDSTAGQAMGPAMRAKRTALDVALREAGWYGDGA